MSTMKPIETTYDGYRFRSRAEARWAVCFNALGWSWRYEAEGYSDGTVAYLPDFEIRSFGKAAADAHGAGPPLFFEVKPEDPPPSMDQTKQQEKWRRLTASTGRELLVAFGAPGDGPFVIVRPCGCIQEAAVGVCPCCGGILSARPEKGMYFSDRARERVLRAVLTEPMVNAIYAARGARFEHGETPRGH